MKRVLLLVGSPRASKSTSLSLGAYLLELLALRGMETERMSIAHSVRAERGLEQLHTAVCGADLVVLAFPLYIDSLPSPVIRAMEFITQRRKETNNKHHAGLLAISNSGFPEAVHSEIALDICRTFASEAGFDWIGGLALGGGEAIAGEQLQKAGGKARFVRRSLELTADAIAAGRPVPREAVELMARPFIPKWMYIFFGGMGWRVKAMRNQAMRRINDRPYRS